MHSWQGSDHENQSLAEFGENWVSVAASLTYFEKRKEGKGEKGGKGGGEEERRRRKTR